MSQDRSNPRIYYNLRNFTMAISSAILQIMAIDVRMGKSVLW